MRHRVRYADPYPLKTLKAEWAVFIMAGKNKNREKYGGISLTRNFIPVMIIPSKVA
jgi:hypothetical protein